MADKITQVGGVIGVLTRKMILGVTTVGPWLSSGSSLKCLFGGAIAFPNNECIISESGRIIFEEPEISGSYLSFGSDETVLTFGADETHLTFGD